MRTTLIRAALGVLLTCTACPPSRGADDAGAGTDAGAADAGQASGFDAGPSGARDAGAQDAGGDLFIADAGTKPMYDAGPYPFTDGGLVRGTRVGHFVTPTKVITVPFDPAADPLRAYATIGTRFYTLAFTTAGDADGGFSFQRPQGGAYYLAVGATDWVYTDAPALDLGYSVQGRPFAVPPNLDNYSPSVTIDATGLTPFDPSRDSFSLSTASVYEWGSLLFEDPLPAQGSTSLTQQKTEFVSNIDQAILEAGKGDTAVFSQSRSVRGPQEDGGMSVLLAWSQAVVPEYQAALDYLDSLAKRMEKTVLGTPPPIGVANELSERFGPKVADLLALRLAKATDWPRWRRIGVLLYLQQQKRPSTTAALLRFAAETDNDEDRSYGVEAIRAIADPELRAKLNAELAHQRANQRGLPAELSGLVP